jgi:hypothetical protein
VDTLAETGGPDDCQKLLPSGCTDFCRGCGVALIRAVSARIDASKVETPSRSTNTAPPTSNTMPALCRQPSVRPSSATSRSLANDAVRATPPMVAIIPTVMAAATRSPEASTPPGEGVAQHERCQRTWDHARRERKGSTFGGGVMAMGKRSPKQVGADEDDEHPARRLELWGSAAVGERPADNRVAC